MTPADFKRIGSLLLSHPYVFAKTMPENPHYYTLRRTWDDAEFVEVVTHMRNHGYVEWYHGRPYKMLNVNDCKYWTMGAPIPDTILINRKVRECPISPYDAIAGQYDDLFRDDESRAEDRKVMEWIGDLSDLSVLDVGCGTGLLLDYQTPRRYMGIDPSTGMISRLLMKHPDRREDVIRCRLEEFVGGLFDAVICLFGAASYITPTFIEAIPALVNSGGWWAVMFYQSGYSPVTYDRSGQRVAHYDGLHADLPGESISIGNFICVRGTHDLNWHAG